MKVKLTNATSKIIKLINGKSIRPAKSIILTLEKGTDLYIQIKNFEKKGSLDILYL